MRRVPGLRCVVVTEPLPVVMADHRRARAALRPVAAGAILAGREGGAVGLGAREDVVHVRRIAAPIDLIALLGERRLLVDVVLAVQLGEVFRDDEALGVQPRAAADAVAGVDRVRALGAQVSAPGLRPRAGRRAEELAELVCPVEAAEVTALSRTCARDEEADLRLLCLAAGAPAERHQERHGHDDRQPHSAVHSGLPIISWRAEPRRGPHKALAARLTVKARSAALNTNDTMPCAAAVRRISLLVMATSDTCDVMPMTNEK